jgi:hypothetical protein
MFGLPPLAKSPPNGSPPDGLAVPRLVVGIAVLEIPLDTCCDGLGAIGWSWLADASLPNESLDDESED